MEDPILIKDATNFRELFGITKERHEELTEELYINGKPTFTIFSKVSSTFLNRAKTTNEQLFMITEAYRLLSVLQQKTDIDIFKVITEDDEDIQGAIPF